MFVPSTNGNANRLLHGIITKRGFYNDTWSSLVPRLSTSEPKDKKLDKARSTTPALKNYGWPQPPTESGWWRITHSPVIVCAVSSWKQVGGKNNNYCYLCSSFLDTGLVGQSKDMQVLSASSSLVWRVDWSTEWDQLVLRYGTSHRVWNRLQPSTEYEAATQYVKWKTISYVVN